MSPMVTATSSMLPSFPRVSGDEPGNKGVTFGLEKFSPRERG